MRVHKITSSKMIRAQSIFRLNHSFAAARKVLRFGRLLVAPARSVAPEGDTRDPPDAAANADTDPDGDKNEADAFVPPNMSLLRCNRSMCTNEKRVSLFNKANLSRLRCLSFLASNLAVPGKRFMAYP